MRNSLGRREFLWRAGVVATAALLPAMGRTQGAESELTLGAVPGAAPIPANYSGLSYELAQLSDPDYFTPDNRDLVAYYRLLSPHGVLRLGGNSSEFCWLRLNANTTEPKLHVPTGDINANWMPHRLFAIDPIAVERLAGFLDATGWKVIFGVNLGNSTPERAAAEAAFAAEKLGDRIEYFQIGNEPDLYHTASNGTRPPNWGFEDYVRDWTGYADAITKRVPGARFGGPDVGASSDWVTRFGTEVAPKLGKRLAAMTGHYYAMGPPDDPRVNIKRLMAGNARIPGEMEKIEAVTRAHGVGYRMTEGNSCYRGGKPGMSDAFASALWAGDYMLELASLGCIGVNLHGGASSFLAASLGDHTPGLDVAKTPQKVKGGYYSPIYSEPRETIEARPIFYGMLLANQFAGGLPMKVEGLPGGVNATAYAVQGAARDKSRRKVAVFNKDEAQGLDVAIPGVKQATAWRLQGPALDATSGVTLAGMEIGEHAAWSPAVVETIAVKDGAARVRVPKASGVLVFVE